MMGFHQRLRRLHAGHSGLVLWYTLLAALVSAWFSAYTWFSLRARLYGELQETLTRRLEQVRDDVLPSRAGRPGALAREIEAVYSPEAANRFIRVTNATGGVLYVSGAPRDRSFDPTRVPSFAASGRVSPRVESGPAGGVYIAALAAGGDLVEMGASTTGIDDTLRKLVLTQLGGLPFVILVAAGGGLVLVRQALKPVEAIRATAEQITFGSSGQTVERVPVPATGDALERLSVTLNRMLERLDGAYAQASRFSADAAHELRTPLSVMRSELDALAAQGHERGLPPEALRHIGSVREEAERLSAIVQGLLTIARLDAGEARMESKDIDLSKLLAATLEQMRLLADNKHLAVTVEAPAPVIVQGDELRLKQVMVNLIDNAVKYTMPGGSVHFGAHPAGDKAVFEARDNGIGIPREALPHVFERFYRADRGQAGAPQGAGLGLSIVRAICQAHGGAVIVDSTEGRGTTVTVELPLAGAAAGGRA
jgi:signal transduction histidine kinase